MFHAAEAYIFAQTGKVAKSHRGVQIEFARLTKAEPRVGRELVTFLSTAYQFKQRADAAIGPAAAPITSGEAATALADAARFIETVTQALPPGLAPPRGTSVGKLPPTGWLTLSMIAGIAMPGHISKVGSGQMYAVLVWAHVSLTMVAFGASPLGRLGLRYLLSGVSEPQSAKVILRGFSGIFLAGGISITAGVCVGLVLAWNAGLTQTWVTASIVLITIAGVGGVAIEDRWVKRLRRAEGDAFAAILHEKMPFLAAIVSPVLWLCILWLMIEKPA